MSPTPSPRPDKLPHLSLHSAEGMAFLLCLAPLLHPSPPGLYFVHCSFLDMVGMPQKGSEGEGPGGGAEGPGCACEGPGGGPGGASGCP